MAAITINIKWGKDICVCVNFLMEGAGDVGDVGLIPVLGRSPGGRHGNPLQYSCVENPMDTGAWWATVHKVIKSQTLLKQCSMHMGIPWHLASTTSVSVLINPYR